MYPDYPCPPGDQTIGQCSAINILTEVTGGQETYIAPNGTLQFTTPHSHNKGDNYVKLPTGNRGSELENSLMIFDETILGPGEL